MGGVGGEIVRGEEKPKSRQGCRRYQVSGRGKAGPSPAEGAGSGSKLCLWYERMWRRSLRGVAWAAYLVEAG
jgi:hypothetical protein